MATVASKLRGNFLGTWQFGTNNGETAHLMQWVFCRTNKTSVSRYKIFWTDWKHRTCFKLAALTGPSTFARKLWRPDEFLVELWNLRVQIAVVNQPPVTVAILDRNAAWTSCDGWVLNKYGQLVTAQSVPWSLLWLLLWFSTGKSNAGLIGYHRSLVKRKRTSF